MIFDSTITSMNESAIDTLLENVEDRFEDSTMAEATAIVVGEQEINWTRFMQGIGLDELKTVMEGQEVVYEGARWEGIVKKAKGFFQMVLTKLAQLTKSFVAKVDQLLKSNDAFVKKYEKDLLAMSVSRPRRAAPGPACRTTSRCRATTSGRPDRRHSHKSGNQEF